MDEKRLTEVSEASPLPTILYDLDGRIQWSNARADKVLDSVGLPFGERLVDAAWEEMFPDLIETEFGDVLSRVAKAAPGHRHTLPLFRGAGSYRLSMVRLSDAVACFFVTASELASAHAETSAARTGDAQLARDFETLQVAYPFGSIATFDADYRCLSVDGAGWAALGIDPESLEGTTFRDLWPGPIADHLEELADIALDGGEASARMQFEESTFEVWAGPLVTDGGSRGMLLSRDVTREVEEATWHRLLAAAVDATPVGITVARLEGRDSRIVFSSEGFEAMTGYSAAEAAGRDLRFLQGEATDPQEVAAMRAAIDGFGRYVGTVANYRKDGELFWNRIVLAPVARTDGEPTDYVGIQEDVTQTRADALEREHLARLSHIGDFAGGVAHDFNNLLLEIGGWTELAIEKFGASEELGGIAGATDRSRKLVKRLLAYASNDGPLPEATGAESASSVAAIVPSLRRIVGNQVRLVLRDTEEPPVFQIDPVRLSQVLLNLVKNATDAMPEGGTIEVTTRMFEDNGFGEIAVADDGVGMSPEVLGRAFDRFFTTKGSLGTGLGLASVRRIVEDANGEVTASSAPGVGTTIVLSLPLASEDRVAAPEPENTWSAEEGPGPRAELGGTRILVAEDDPDVRQVVKRVLERVGAEVVVVSDGAAALEAYSDSAFDVVLTDRDMPRLNGVRLVNLALREAHRQGRDPGRFVIMSGDSSWPSGLPTGSVMIKKPFRFAELLEALSGRG